MYGRTLWRFGRFSKVKSQVHQSIREFNYAKMPIVLLMRDLIAPTIWCTRLHYSIKVGHQEVIQCGFECLDCVVDTLVCWFDHLLGLETSTIWLTGSGSRTHLWCLALVSLRAPHVV